MSLSLKPRHVLVLAALLTGLYKLVHMILARLRTTKLRGPPSPSWLYGVQKETITHDAGQIYEDWAKEYGPVYQVPAILGDMKVVLTDPKAIRHFYDGETTTYVKPESRRHQLESVLGRGVLWAEGDDHKRQRRAMTPAFSNASIRNFTPIFYDSAYKLKDAWDNILLSTPSGSPIIDVENWMNHVSLDSIGIAGFSHDFGALSTGTTGNTTKKAEIVDILDAFGASNVGGFSDVMFLLGPIIPFLSKIPSERKKLRKRLHDIMGEIAEELLRRTAMEKEMSGDFKYSPGQSIIGALIKAEHTDGELSMTHQEVLAQMNVLMLAGYETTSISMTWALYELSAHPDKQDKLRAELEEFGGADPTYDQLTNDLPYLNAVCREVLRLHPAVQETTRVAAHDDILPLSSPLPTASGSLTDTIVIAKGTTVTVPIRTVNRSSAIWGPDSKEFVPERWLNDEQKLSEQAKEIQGYSHLLTFVEGARTCLGKGFAVAEFKAVLSVLIRNYKFALRDGPDTHIHTHWALLKRPAVDGEEGAKMPLRVTRV